MAGEFIAKDGRPVAFRKPKWEDLDGLLDILNSVVREGAPVNRTTGVSRSEEIDFLARRLAEIERGTVIQLIAEVDGELAANAEIRKGAGRQSHVGSLGIIVKSGFRHMGIGAKLMERLISEGKKQGLKIITLQVNETNLPAISLYRKLGFRETGRIPKAISWNGKYVDDVTMVIEIS
jgi:L-amino acid N-acyltransferase YncA